MTSDAPIQFIDLHAQRNRLGDALEQRILDVTRSGRYILGPEVGELEEKLAQYVDAPHCASCANGTDAIAIPLRAWGIGKGDAVFCPPFTFVATAEVICWTDASPVFVDIDADTYNMSPAALEAAIKDTLAKGELTPKAVIAVDLFGQPADYPALRKICDTYGLKLISDSAQGYGCRLDGKSPMAWADFMTTSFYPAKPLGAYGDGGAMFAKDDETNRLMRSIRVHGEGTHRYENVRIGMNSRLDTIQATVLLAKLEIFADEIEARNKVADRYAAGLKTAKAATVIEGGLSTWAQYTIEHDNRDGLREYLGTHNIPSVIYYPIPLHQQKGYDHYPVGPGGCPVSEDKADKVLSLPMHPYLPEDQQSRIIDAINGFQG